MANGFFVEGNNKEFFEVHNLKLLSIEFLVVGVVVSSTYVEVCGEPF